MEETEIGMKGNEIRFEFRLETETVSLCVNLRIFRNGVQDFFVFKSGVSDCVELDRGFASEL